MNRQTSPSRRHPRFTLLVATVAATMALASSVAAVAAADPVGAAAAYRPDGRILQLCQYPECEPTWAGDNVYNVTGTGQKSVWTDYGDLGTGDPAKVVFRISIQNDGTRADRFNLAAAGTTSGYRVRFFRGTTNITPAVMAGTYRTPSLAPGETFLIKAKVTLVDACCGDKATRLVTITSVGNGGQQDAVKLVRKFWVCGC